MFSAFYLPENGLIDEETNEHDMLPVFKEFHI